MIQKKIRIGDILEEKGLITHEQLEMALVAQKNSNFSKKLGQIFIDEGFLSDRVFAETLATQLDIDFIDLYGVEVDFVLMSKYPVKLLKGAEAIPFMEDEEFIHVAAVDPLDYESLELLERSIATKPIKLYIALKNDVYHIFDRFEILSTTKLLVDNIKHEIASSNYKADSEQSSVMQLIEQIIKSAIKKNASDIHIEPSAFNVSVRSRIDGVLRENFVFDIEIYNAIASRIKILGNLDISEKRKSQDGRFSMTLNNNTYDFRLSTAPTMFGESIVMRILDQQKILLKLRDLGMDENNIKLFEEILKYPYGIIFVTGPTGSGKTTTLYAALNEIKSIENKMITIEDPIEYQLPLAQQIQINEKIHYSFAEALRSILRQDPDIIMVGEVRDKETLDIGVQASLTGHLVFSTLHTNDAPSAITRMIQMGLEPYLIADSLVGVIAQRLVRKICPYCKKEYKPLKVTLDKIEKFLPEEYTFYKGEGCMRCNFTGYSGRTMISEILQITETISHLISINMNKYEIARKAEEDEGFQPMIHDGIKKALAGITTLEEVLRVAK
ncbi:GspE/PulE family protein [Sulfurospirillum sp. 1612]|uniref:GspE/PulE family protein n=1 Tax=Sulfurospirillum sp. 1612 TaxID=3094835 RepID=UPI002F92504A